MTAIPRRRGAVAILASLAIGQSTRPSPLAAQLPDERSGAGTPFVSITELAAEPALVTYPEGSRLDGAAEAAMSAFFREYSSQFEIRWDIRSDRPHLVQGVGIPLIPGRGNTLRREGVGLPLGRRLEVADLEPLLRRFMERFPELFRVGAIDLALDPSRSVRHGTGDRHWFVEFRQVHDGVPVDGASVFFYISHGNIVQFGTDRVADVRLDAAPRLARAAALRAGLAATGVRPEDVAEMVDAGTRKILPASSEGARPGEGYAGPAGEGYRHLPAWEFRFRRRGDARTYDVIVDAGDGRLLQFIDANGYATVTGGIYPVTNTDLEELRGFPYARVTNGMTKFTDSTGVYNYTGGTAAVTLDGQYTRIVDACGPILLSNSVSGNLHLGTSGGTDCTTPGVGGAGNTHAARSSFYHLTKANRKAATFMPGNSWLLTKVTANTNLNSQNCNAFWNGSTLNFFKSVGGCSNTGELAGVILHEWAHGLDENTGGAANEKASGEAAADTIAFLETRDGCIGQNLQPGVNCPNCTDCSGVRDVSDFDTSGPAVIAKPSNVANNAGINCDRLACPYPGFQGPMGYHAHCESLIASSANWDLTTSLIAAHGTEAGWARMSKIWYVSLTPTKNAYQLVAGGKCNPSATVNGCARSNWYTAYLWADDDNGTLRDGTPNACRIWDAFNAHGIACGARPRCS
jgi:hypothetical protein